MAKPEVKMMTDAERMRAHAYTYIAGPMTGYPEFNRPEFNRVASLLRDAGVQVINPVELDSEGYTDDDPWDMFLRRDLIVIAKDVGRVVLLHGWQNSHGATLEKYVAEHLGCEIIYSGEFDEWYEGLREKAYQR